MSSSSVTVPSFLDSITSIGSVFKHLRQLRSSFCIGTIVSASTEDVQLDMERNTENSSVAVNWTSCENLTSGQHCNGGY